MKKITECKTMCWAPHFQFLCHFFPALWWLIMTIGGGIDILLPKWSFKNFSVRVDVCSRHFCNSPYQLKNGPFIPNFQSLFILFFYPGSWQNSKVSLLPTYANGNMFFLVSSCKVLIVWLSSSISQPHAALRPPSSVPVQTWNSSRWIIKTENTPRVHHSSL